MSAWLDSARRAFQAGNLPETERLCRAAMAAKPSDFDAHYLLGIVQMQRGEFLPAEQSIGAAFPSSLALASTARFLLLSAASMFWAM